jgi:hypothetical protein
MSEETAEKDPAWIEACRCEAAGLPGPRLQYPDSGAEKFGSKWQKLSERVLFR